jgi:hypothetical protein
LFHKREHQKSPLEMSLSKNNPFVVSLSNHALRMAPQSAPSFIRLEAVNNMVRQAHHERDL